MMLVSMLDLSEGAQSAALGQRIIFLACRGDATFE